MFDSLLLLGDNVLSDFNITLHNIYYAVFGSPSYYIIKSVSHSIFKYGLWINIEHLCC